MSRVDNITLKIILLIVIIIVFFRTMSVKKTRELKEFLNKILQRYAILPYYRKLLQLLM